MDKHPIGTTGLSVTPICFGASGLGNMPDTYGYEVGEDRARATVAAIFDSPVNFLDTARIYGHGRSEERIGAVIAEQGLPEGFVLSTKLDRDFETGRFDADRVHRSIEESLKALNLDRVQVLHLHDPEYASDLADVTRDGGAVDALFRLKEEGLCDAVGLAAGRIDIMDPILRSYPFDTLISHNRYTLVNRAADEMFDYAHGAGMAILNAAPFAGGVLAKGSAEMPKITYQDADDAALEPVRRIETACAEHGSATGAAALQFSMRDPRICSTVIGVSKPERIAQTLDWANAETSDGLWHALAALDYSVQDPEAQRDYKPG